jgi:hypothetical protein
MRVYIIGNDGIMLCREAPATVNEGEIAIASNAGGLAAGMVGSRGLPDCVSSTITRTTLIWYK